MWQTTTMINCRTYKVIDNKNTVICIDDVKAITLVKIVGANIDEVKYAVGFWINGIRHESDGFNTEEEAIKFRNKTMEWNNE